MTIFSCNFNVNILAVIVSVIIRGRAFLRISLELHGFKFHGERGARLEFTGVWGGAPSWGLRDRVLAEVGS